MKNATKSILFIVFVFVSCIENKKDSIIISKDSTIKLSYTIDTLSINLDGFLKHDYPYASHFENEKTNYFIGYNEISHKLDVFDLINKNYVTSIPIERDGPNGLDEPWDFYIHNLDSIFYLSKNGALVTLDMNGEVSKKANLSKINPYKGIKAHPISFKIYFDKERNRVYFNSYSYRYLPNEQGYYEEPFIAFYSFLDNKIHQLPLKFPDSYKKNNSYYGEYFEPNVFFKNDSIIYSFPAEPDFYIYDISSAKLGKFRAESKISSNMVEMLPSESYSDINLRMIHLIENPFFHLLIPDQHRKLYYRLHTSGIPFTTDGQSFNYQADKNEFLMVFDEKLNVIQEIELPSKFYNTNSMFVGKEGLFIPYSHFLNPNLDEEKLQFHLFKFEKSID